MMKKQTRPKEVFETGAYTLAVPLKLQIPATLGVEKLLCLDAANTGGAYPARGSDLRLGSDGSPASALPTRTNRRLSGKASADRLRHSLYILYIIQNVCPENDGGIIAQRAGFVNTFSQFFCRISEAEFHFPAHFSPGAVLRRHLCNKPMHIRSQVRTAGRSPGFQSADDMQSF